MSAKSFRRVRTAFPLSATEVAAARPGVASARKTIRAITTEGRPSALSIRASRLSVAHARSWFSLSRTSVRAPATPVALCGIAVGVGRSSVAHTRIAVGCSRLEVALGETGFRPRATSVAAGRKQFWLAQIWFRVGENLGGESGKTRTAGKLAP